MRLDPAANRWLKSGIYAALAATLVSAAASAAGDNDDDTKLQQIVVTAQKIEVSSLKDQNNTGSRLSISALDTPASVEGVTADEIQLRGDENVVDAVAHSTGISSQYQVGSGGYGFAVRGFSGWPSVTILYDGTKSLINTGNMTYPWDTWNVDRIEVLNGPASVLYGGGAIGAAINVIPRTPDATSENTIRLEGGSFETYGAAIDSTGPLIDNVLYRLDVSHNSSDGYVDRGQSSGTTSTGALSYRAADNLSFTLSVDYSDRKAMDYNGVPLINGVAEQSLWHVNYDTYDATVPFTDERAMLTTDWQASEDLKIHNITYYIEANRLWREAYTFEYQPADNDIMRSGFGSWQQYQNQVGDHVEAAWTHRLFGLANTLSFGFDLDNLTNKRFVNLYDGTDVVDLQNSDPGVFPGGAYSQDYQKSSAHQYAPFAEDRLVLVPSLSLIGGLRMDHTILDREDLVAYTRAYKTWTPVSWRVGAVYEVLHGLNLYAQYSTAFDPVDDLAEILVSELAFNVSKGTQVEAGLKEAALNDRLEWTLAAYKIIKNNLLTPDPANLELSIPVGQQSSRGVEASLALRLTDSWQIEVNGTILTAQYDDFSETGSSGTLMSLAGYRPIDVPDRLANLWAIWSFAPRWLVQAGVGYTGDMYADSANTERLPAHTVVNAGLRWLLTDKMTLDLRVDNAFDKFYAETSVGSQWVLGAPRSAMVSFTAKF